MPNFMRSGCQLFRRICLAAALCAMAAPWFAPGPFPLGVASAAAAETPAKDKPAAPAPPIEKGQRVLSAGHSFHFFVPFLLSEMAITAKIADHQQVDVQGIGGSRTIQHWDVPDDQNKVKRALRAGNVDVLTLSPIFLPDEGIGNFARLALQQNPTIRITVQECWLPFDNYNLENPLKKIPVDHNARTGDELRKIHADYFRSMDEHVAALNKELGKEVLFVVPAGQAVIAFREKIAAGQAAGLKSQQELFVDDLGHGSPPLLVLVTYCHYAVIYRRSPVGLPLPSVLSKTKNAAWDDALNRVLQETAWDAVTAHPQSGVRRTAIK